MSKFETNVSSNNRDITKCGSFLDNNKNRNNNRLQQQLYCSLQKQIRREKELFLFLFVLFCQSDSPLLRHPYSAEQHKTLHIVQTFLGSLKY